uniref:Two-component response regulator n=1 Tax=Ananas comosus var. bracteatus TaxID=296719 RepID=A0A6V7PP03_ANACO|nr:unnamed protein product [Ananas comosus var. bracteatus]
MIGFDFGVFEGCFGGSGIFWAALSGVFGKGVAMAEEWAEWDRFPVGLKVLVVDDDDTCLTILKQKLLRCCYDVTTCSEATKALSLLRESKGGFDVVISDVHMPDMDGFRLLELVGLEMDLPVIMMSADTRTSLVMKGIKHGACDYLIKPVRIEELKNIWQHVFRKNKKNMNHQGEGADGSSKSQKKRRDVKEEDDGELENSDPSSSKKPRVVWSVELHQQFVHAVNHLGFDKAVPKKILELMNVPGLTRENVASHLQKFRLYLKKMSEVSQQQTPHHNSFSGLPSNVRANPLNQLDLQSWIVSSQITPQTLAAFQNELLGQPSNNLILSGTDQPSLRQVSVQAPNLESERVFSWPILKSQPNLSRQLSQASAIPVEGISSAFPSWSCDDLSGQITNSRNSTTMAQILQQQQQGFDSFDLGKNSVLINQNPVLPTSSTNQDPNFSLSQSSASINAASSCGLLDQKFIIANTNVETRCDPFQMSQHSMKVTSQASSDLLSQNSSYNNSSIGIVDYSLLMPQSKSVRFGVGQVVANSYSVPELDSSHVSSCIDDAIWGQLRNLDWNINNLTSGPPSLVPNSCNIQNSSGLLSNLPNPRQGRSSLGFVGKGTCIPSRFAINDVESPTNNLSHSNTCTDDGGDMPNAVRFGLNGQL